MPKKTKPEDVAQQVRRRRYERLPSQDTFVSLTPVKVQMLRYLAELRFLSLPQLARLCCPSESLDLSEKRARRYLRTLFDAGLVDVLPVSRAALATPGAPNDASLLYGSAPNIYAPTARSLEMLLGLELIGEAETRRPKSTYGPRNSLFLAHELAVRDVRVWLEVRAGNAGRELACWQDGEAAAIDLNRTSAPHSLKPDAWFVLQLQQAVLVGLVEMDRGTERGDRRWCEKLGAYEALFAEGQLQKTTGYRNARVLILVQGARRRDSLAALIRKNAAAGLANRFWLTDWSTEAPPDLSGNFWCQPGGTGGLKPLVPPAA